MCDYKLNRFNKKILDAIKELLLIGDKIDLYIEEGSQDSLENLALTVKNFKKIWENIELSLFALAKNIAGDEEIDVEETENGLKL